VEVVVRAVLVQARLEHLLVPVGHRAVKVVKVVAELVDTPKAVAVVLHMADLVAVHQVILALVVVVVAVPKAWAQRVEAVAALDYLVKEQMELAE